jgi:hypothetical protein
VERQRLVLEAVDRLGAPAAGGARQAGLGRQVEEEREVGHGVADHQALEAADQLGVDPAQRALVDAGRIDEAVAHHPLGLIEGRPDGGADVVVARRREQQRLGQGPERLGGARQQHVAHDIGASRSPGLARHHHRDGVRAQAPGQQLGLGRLSRPLAALEGNETSAHLAMLGCVRALISVCCRNGTAQ